MRCTIDISVPGIPLCRVIHLVGKDVAGVVAHVVRLVEDICESLIYRVAFIVFFHNIIAILVLSRHYDSQNRIGDAIVRRKVL